MLLGTHLAGMIFDRGLRIGAMKGQGLHCYSTRHTLEATFPEERKRSEGKGDIERESRAHQEQQTEILLGNLSSRFTAMNKNGNSAIALDVRFVHERGGAWVKIPSTRIWTVRELESYDYINLILLGFVGVVLQPDKFVRNWNVEVVGVIGLRLTHLSTQRSFK